MKSNISLTAALSLLLAACGGGRSYSNYAPEPAGPPEPTTWRTADGSLRSRPADDFGPPADGPAPYIAPGADYAAPGAGYTPPRPNAAPPPPRPFTPPPAPQDGMIDPAAGATGPSGSSRPGPGETRYDELGYAGVRPVAGGGAADAAVVAVHRSLPVNTIVEVTALDTGRTILVLITGTMDTGAYPMALSAGAARQLGVDGAQSIAVRVRRVAAAPQDVAALRAGQPAAARPDTPPILLTALRKRLPAAAAAAPTRPAPAPGRATRPPAPPRAARAPAGSGYFVQVAALSNARNAQALAQSMRGFVKQGGGLHRVQLGPFATQREAETARAGAVRAGYRDARVFAVN
ncbi:SPOR domain-containing protein [Sphingomonas sp. M1-B02]|uniref:SPOR domain-containing protein n=1 Tax=Sphingomonas sp. M1-B02 TaxID=3114300 RepID=UPI00223F8732|nr:SPOR domain-containing protein [Sphingomonas sp. S6-11]UZK66936.1 SPOR domain-containing protein [Sphingomonas sp. S6-11]